MSGGPLSVRLRVPLDRFALEVEATLTRQVTGLFGPSGAGKTTLLRAVAGLERRGAGRIAMGDDVWLDSDRRLWTPPEGRGLGYVPQEGLLFPHLDVRRNVLFGAERARARGSDPLETLATVSEILGLEPLFARGVGSLSGGERQRVALARAICSGPQMLLLDEPLASLDRPLRRRILPLLERIRRELRVPMLLISHDPDEVRALCDHVVSLEAGRIVAEGPPDQVLAGA